LEAGAFPNTSPTHQILWAILTQKESRAALVLHFGKQLGFDKMLDTLAKLRRTVLRAEQDQYFSSGQTSDNAAYLEERFKRYVSTNV
jgi:hypothetical protein